MSLARTARLINSTNPSKEIARRWTRAPQLSARAVEAVEIIVAERLAEISMLAEQRARMALHVERGEQAERNIETQLADWREGWARDAMLIPAWNKMTVEEAIAFVRGGEADRG